jgi:hypothetical protein
VDIARAIRATGFTLLGHLLLLTMLASSKASAEPATPQYVGAAERYFIEFRARPSSFVGHTYVVYGRTDSAGRILDQHYAGLLPDTKSWGAGVLIAVPATVREDQDDAKLRPDTIYRRPLSAAEYTRVSRTVGFLRNTEHEWHLIFQNCNDFGIALAEALGMRRPPSVMIPVHWVSMLRALNE